MEVKLLGCSCLEIAAASDRKHLKKPDKEPLRANGSLSRHLVVGRWEAGSASQSGLGHTNKNDRPAIFGLDQ